ERIEELPGPGDVVLGQPVPGEQRADGAAGGPAEADDLERAAHVLVAEQALEHTRRERRMAPAALTGDRDPSALAGRRHAASLCPGGEGRADPGLTRGRREAPRRTI